MLKTLLSLLKTIRKILFKTSNGGFAVGRPGLARDTRTSGDLWPGSRMGVCGQKTERKHWGGGFCPDDKALAEGRPDERYRGWAVRNFIRYQRWGILAKPTQWAKDKAQGQGLLRKWARRT